MLKERVIKECEKRGISEDIFVLETFFAIFCKMKKEGYDEISLKSSDLSDVIPQLEELFRGLGIISDAFCKDPVSEVYNRFHCYVIECLYARGYGFFNVDYNKVIININDYMIHKTLKKNEEISDIIDEGYLIMTGQQEEKDLTFQFVKNK